MKKIILSIIALVYIVVFKITDFETGDVTSATILIYIGVPLFILISIILFIISLFKMYRERANFQLIYLMTVIINIMSVIIFYLF
jgi:hypothetical protein